MQEKFQQQINDSKRILITSHTSPDPDAVSSLLLLGTTIELNFPDKQIQMVLEEEPDSLNFMAGYEKIKFTKLPQALAEFKPELIIVVDANSFDRVCRRGAQQIRDYIAQNNTKTAIIDHHEPEGKDPSDVLINSQAPAAVQEVYSLCFDRLKLNKPDGYANTTMTGLYSDTGGFVYPNSHYKETFKLASDLVDAGANIEAAKNHLNQYTEDRLKVITELLANISHQDDYTYTYISDKFIEDWVSANKSMPALHSARKKFVDDYIRNVEGRQWGFVISLDPQEDGHMYSISLRSVGGVKDVAVLSKKFDDGGGHKSAAGGRVQAASLEEAIDKVKKTIAQTD